MEENYKPYVPLVLCGNYFTENIVNDALVKAVKMGVPTKPFRFGEYFGFDEFEEEIAQFRRHIDGIAIIIEDLNLVQEIEFEELLQKAINYGICRYVIVHDSFKPYDFEDSIAEEDIERLFSKLSLVKVQFKYVCCPVKCGDWESADEIRPFIEEINKTIVEPAMEDNDFRLPIKQVFSVKNMGVIAVGTVLHGSLDAGEHVVILGGGKRILASVKAFELRRNIVDRVTVGDDTGVILQGVNAEDISSGMMIISF